MKQQPGTASPGLAALAVPVEPRMPDHPSSQLNGNLSTMNLADLLQWVCLGHKTGTLHLQNGRIRKEVYFHEGRLVSAGSNLPRERLGQFLLHHGRITEENLRAALSDQKSGGRPLGEILCGMGILDPDSLIRILQLKAEETIFDLFLWNEGNFHFVADQLPDWSITKISLDVTGLTLEGVRRKDEMGLIRESLPTNRMLLAVAEGRAAQAAALTGFDRHLVNLVRQGKTIAEISEQSRAPEFVLLKRLHEFVEQGLLRVKQDLSRDQRPADQLTFDEGLARCRQCLDAEDLAGALPCLAVMRGQAADEPGGRDELAALEKAATNLIYSTIISPSHIPVLKSGMDQLVKLELNAEEGFIVSRIDGVMDIRSVIQVSPVSEFETLIIFRRLLGEQVIDLTGTSEIARRRGSD
jgi:hypothetical protein